MELEAHEIVNQRVMIPGTAEHSLPGEGSVEAMVAVLARLRQRGLIGHLGLSNVTSAQVAEARTITPLVCVQNQYHLVQRGGDALGDELAAAGIAYVPFFPLGGFSPIQSRDLPALARLLHRPSNILPIPGTS